MPKLSIITINLNNLTGLQKTMQSVFDQTFADYEYIIIDGGSIDGSKEMIEQYSDKLTYWVSEKDGGIYDALNKGSKIANGEYLHHLNSGDTYFNDDVLRELFSKNRVEDFIYGNQNLIGYFLKNYPSELTFEFFCRDAVPHQATIIKRIFFEKAGPFSKVYSMGGDYKFFLEAVFLYQCSYRYSNITMVNYDMAGISTLNSQELIKEFATIRTQSLPNLSKEFTHLYENKMQLLLLQNSRLNRLRKKIKKLFRV